MQIKVTELLPYDFFFCSIQAPLDKTLLCDHANMKAIETSAYVSCCLLCCTKWSVGETLVCDHPNESYWAGLSCGTVYYAVQGGSNF